MPSTVRRGGGDDVAHDVAPRFPSNRPGEPWFLRHISPLWRSVKGAGERLCFSTEQLSTRFAPRGHQRNLR
jgi:hypothetical protein